MGAALPLYPNGPSSSVLGGEGLLPSATCSRCRLANGARQVCLPAEGDPDRRGGVLLVRDAPSREDSLRWRPFADSTGQYVRQLVAKFAPGVSVTLDNAVKCAPGVAPIDKAIQECRPYLRSTVRQAVPDRIIAFGAAAIRSLTGRSVWPLGVRGGYGWHTIECPDCEEAADHGADCGCAGTRIKRIPIFYVLDPVEALQNRFLRTIFEVDLKVALTTPIPVPREWDGTARIIRTGADAEAAEQELRSGKWFSFDCEWAGNLYNDSWKLLSVACTPAGASYAWVWDAEALAKHDVAVKVKRALEDPKVGKVGHYMQADAQAVKLGLGARIPDEAYYVDTFYLLSLLDPEADGALEAAAERVGMGGHKSENDAQLKEEIKRFRDYVKKKHDKSVKATAKRAQVSLFEATQDAAFGTPIDPFKEWPDLTPALLAEIETAVVNGEDSDELLTWAYGLVPRDILSRYNALDTIATARLAELLLERLAADAWEIRRTWEENLRPAIPAIVQVEEWGFRADADNVVVMRTWLRDKLNGILERFRPYGWDSDPTKSKLNLESNDDLANLLYDTLRDAKGNKLKCTQFTAGGARATNKEALQELEGQHPLIADLLEYKRVSTQLKKHLGKFIRSDGRIHTRFNLAGARTGRLSSNDPNMQNQKRAEDDEGRLTRNCFVAAPGWTLAEVDQAQVELRIGMGLANDPVGIGIFKSGRDFHMESAKLVSRIRWGIPPEQVTEQHRQENKPTTFAVFYDDEVWGLAFRLGISPEEAQKVLEGLFGAFKRLPLWINECVNESLKTGVSWSWWNGRRCRRRPLYNLGSPDKAKFKTARRGAWNGPTQATANEFVLAALVKMVRWIREEGLQDVVRLGLTIHDALVFEIRDDYVDLVLHMAYRIMTSFRTPNGVPLDVDFKTGKIWGEMKKYKMKKPVELGHLPYDEPDSYPEAKIA